jgi:hypothetical protein
MFSREGRTIWSALFVVDVGAAYSRVFFLTSGWKPVLKRMKAALTTQRVARE